jgi:hypothetical protein
MIIQSSDSLVYIHILIDYTEWTAVYEIRNTHEEEIIWRIDNEINYREEERKYITGGSIALP